MKLKLHHLCSGRSFEARSNHIAKSMVARFSMFDGASLDSIDADASNHSFSKKYIKSKICKFFLEIRNVFPSQLGFLSYGPM
jgi:hypothetical protein